jgi:hypothetical protein
MSPALLAGFAGGLAGPDAPRPLHAPPRAPALAWIKADPAVARQVQQERNLLQIDSRKRRLS